MTASIDIVNIPAASGGTGSRYDKYLEAALKAPRSRNADGGIKGIEVPVPTSASSTVSNLGQLIRNRGLPLRVLRRGDQVFVARREEGK